VTRLPQFSGDQCGSALSLKTAPSANVLSFDSGSQVDGKNAGLIAQSYPNRIPDGEYLAFCHRSYWDRKSRRYGEKIYVNFRIFEGPHADKELRLFLRPSAHHTSNFYRAWSIANDGPPHSRRTKLSPKVFEGKLFRIQTTTVKPRHQLTGPDGKQRPGEVLPEHLWYSKVHCVLSLEVTNVPDQKSSPTRRKTEGLTLAGVPSSAPPWRNGAKTHSLKKVSSNPSELSDLHEGRVGRRELGSGNWVSGASATGRGGQSDNAPQPADEQGDLLVGSTPFSQKEKPAPRIAARSIPKCVGGNRDHLEAAIYRKKLFELYDNLPPRFDLQKRIEQMICKAVEELFLNRSNELNGVPPEEILMIARERLSGFRHFEFIDDWEKRRNMVVACVVNSVTDAALKTLAERKCVGEKA